MTDLELIAELDKRLDLVNQRMSDEVAEIMSDKTLTKKQKAELSDSITTWYAGIASDIIVMREAAFDREYLSQQKKYEAGFEKKKTEKAYNYSKIRKNGKWVDRKGEDE